MQRWFLVAALTAGTVSLASAARAQTTTSPGRAPICGGFGGGIAPSANPFSQGFPRGAFFPFSGQTIFFGTPGTAAVPSGSNILRAQQATAPAVGFTQPTNGIPGQGIPTPPVSGVFNPANPLGAGVSPATTLDPTFGLGGNPLN